MALDSTAIGRRFGPVTGVVSRERLLFFAKATGETRAEYCDVAAARAAGWRDLPASPTFLFCMMFLDVADPLAPLLELGIDLSRMLHGEQAFEYHADVCAGDVLTLESEVLDVVEKKGGALKLMPERIRVTNQEGVLVASMVRTVAARGS